MSIEFRPNSMEIHDRMLKGQRLMMQVTVGADATPADKTHSDDLSGKAILRTEGKTAEADALEDVSGDVTAPADATGLFAVLVDDEMVEKIYKVDVEASNGTIALGAQGAKVTSEGRMVIDLDSSLDFSAAGATFTIIVDYTKKR